MDLRGKVAIVTGASRGIGKAIVLELARAGAHAVIAARSERDIRDVADEVRRLGAESLPLRTDVTRESDVQDMVKQAIDRLGRVDVLVNNAGLMGRETPFLETALEDWDAIVQSNLYGAFICARAVAPHMVRQGSGAIINITSGAAVRTGFLNVPYGVAKAGMDRLTLGIAAELTEKGVACVSLSPPTTDTETVRAIYPDRDVPSWAAPPELTARALRLLLEEGPLEHSGKVVSVREYLRGLGQL